MKMGETPLTGSEKTEAEDLVLGKPAFTEEAGKKWLPLSCLEKG